MSAVARRFRAWTALAVLLTAAFAFAVAPKLKFQTDILALLPQGGEQPDVDRALQSFGDGLGRNAVFLVSAGDFDTARRAAGRFAAVLQASPAFAQVQLQVDAGLMQQIAAAYVPYRFGLLSDRARTLLQAGDDAALLGRARQALYTPAAFLRRSDVGTDPLDLFGDFLAQVTPAGGRLSLRDGVLAASVPPPAGNPAAGSAPAVLVRVVLAGNAFSTAEEDAAGRALESAAAAAREAGASVSGSGLIQHAVAAARLARRETSWFAGIQLLCLSAVMLWVFRSARVLVFSALALGMGVIAALAVCNAVFGQVHVLTLVFCSNLAGVAIDYSLYYCADQFREPGRWRAADALPQIGRAVGMSCLVAVMSYALLAVAPFPGLRQMALFCCVGLAVAYVCVMAWFPYGIRAAPAAHAERLNRRFSAALAGRERLAGARPAWLLPAAALLILAGLARLHFADDVRVLQPTQPALLQQEETVRGAIGSVADSQFFLVRADDPEALLQTEERLRQRLEPLIAHGAVESYTAVSRAVPSAARQAQDAALLASRVCGGQGLAARFMQEVGFAPAVQAQYLAACGSAAPVLTPDTWLRTPAADPYRHLWLGRIAGAASRPYASVVSLNGVEDVAVLAAAAQPAQGVVLVDRVAETSAVIKRYRQIALAIVASAAFASAAVLMLPYGRRRGLKLMAAPCAAVLGTLGVLGWLGVAVTFFHVVALHLVMGLAMEYAILLQLRELRGPSTLLAVTLACGLAFMAFGLLAFSATPFIHAIGLTVAIGVVLGLAFAAVLGVVDP